MFCYSTTLNQYTFHQRPNYRQLNPFFANCYSYTYCLGKPGLRPQCTHAFGLTQVFKKTYNLVFNYQLVQYVIAAIHIIDAEIPTTLFTIGNVNNFDQYFRQRSVNVMLRYRFS
ncbi:outer membrane beta-barrel protein [Pontibacter sp. H249]|uniref:outer membrane beta-barrel protein n=1 Tax=Pontibacter sp. H249 TaxID=3133420 RepID=UPI0030BD16CC